MGTPKRAPQPAPVGDSELASVTGGVFPSDGTGMFVCETCQTYFLTASAATTHSQQNPTHLVKPYC